MTFYAVADKTDRIGEYDTVTEARRASVRFLKKYSKGFDSAWIYDGRKIHGVVSRNVFLQPEFEYLLIDADNGKSRKYDLYTDGRLGQRRI